MGACLCRTEPPIGESGGDRQTLEKSVQAAIWPAQWLAALVAALAFGLGDAFPLSEGTVSMTLFRSRSVKSKDGFLKSKMHPQIKRCL